MTNVLDDMKTIMVDQQLADAGDIWKGNQPDDTPDSFILLRLAPGPQSENTHDQLPSIEFPNVQIISRGKDFESELNRAFALHDALYRLRDVTANGVRYLSVTPSGTPFEVEPPDDDDRFSLGFIVECQRAALGP